LIMGAMSTVLFANVQLARGPFGFGVVSLLSSLIAIGFGTGLMYVLGDVDGEVLHKIGRRYPILFVFALSIPQVWASICIASFFLCTGTFAWNASDKGWTAKAGIIFSAALTLVHLIAFARLFYKQQTVETLIDDDLVDNGGMDHNIHLAQLTQVSASQSPEMSKGVSSSPPQDKSQYVAQYGGSGADNPPAGARSGPQSKPLVESPGPTSQEFAIKQSSGGSGGGNPSAGAEEETPATQG